MEESQDGYIIDKSVLEGIPHLSEIDEDIKQHLEGIKKQDKEEEVHPHKEMSSHDNPGNPAQLAE